MAQVLLLVGWSVVLAAVSSPEIAASSAGPPSGPVPDPQTPYFELESKVSVGNKGEESLSVSVDAPCDRPAWVFDHAELKVRRNRFGDVQFVELPSPGCFDCAPIRLRWFHEPTGYLSFEVNVYRRLEIISCRIENS